MRLKMEREDLLQQPVVINQLDEDEKKALIKIIYSMLTKKRMKDFLDGKVKYYSNYHCYLFCI